MNRKKLLEKLAAIPGGNWNDGMGRNSVRDFLTIPDAIKNDDEIMQALWWAVEHEIETALDAAIETIDPETLNPDESASRCWEDYCNGLITVDMAHIQAMLDEFAQFAQ
jgi:hypothetical protein